MSHTLNQAGDRESPEMARASSDFSDMMRRGRSFSGHERHCCFLNTGAAAVRKTADGVARFANISATSGIDLPDDGRALVAVDWDHDGDLDLWFSNRNAPRLRFLRNDVPSDHHHLAVRLVGNGRSTNRDAIGARVDVVLAQKTTLPLIKTLRAGDAFLSQSSKWLHFGLGDADAIEKVRVRWPGGDVETFIGLTVDRRYRLVQGSGKAEMLPAQNRVLAISPAPVSLPAEDSTARIPTATSLPMLKLSYLSFSGDRRRLPIGEGKPVLLNLWASWCRPCLAELKELGKREPEIRAAGIDVVALAVDGLGDDRSDPAAAEQFVKRLEFPFTAGRATEGLIAFLQNVHDHLITRKQPLPIPVSFLIDTDGRIAVIYKGRLRVDDLLDDATHSRGTLLERFARSAPIAGRTLPIATASRRLNQIEARFHFATYLQGIGFSADAAAEYRQLIKLSPKDAMAHNNLGIAYAKQRNFRQAEASFRESLRVQPDFDRAHANLGTLLAQQGHLEQAERHFGQALRNKPKAAEHYVNLGGLLLRRGRWREAQSRLEQALAINPNLADAHAHLGRALAEQGRHTQAVTHLQQALKIQPNHPDARRNLDVVKQLIAEGN